MKGYKTRQLRLRRNRSILYIVKDVIWKELCSLWDFTYARAVVCGDNIFVVGYGESALIHKKRKCIYKRDEYFRLEVGKFLCREPLKIPDRVILLLEGELHNSDNVLYCYSQVDSLTIAILQ